jgi:phosphohistidine phosphatase
MTRLFLVRHGIALPHGSPGVAEDDRPLTPRGERRVRRIARGLRRLGVEPDRVITSPLPRARRTAEIIAGVLDLTDRLEEADALRAGNPATAIAAWLGPQAGDDLMLVGHDPSLTDLLGLLIGLTSPPLPFGLKKGGIAALRRGEGDRYTLQWLATPRLIRGLLG